MGAVGGLVNSVAGAVLGTGGTTQANMLNQENLINQANREADRARPLQSALQKQAMTGGGPLAKIFQNQLGQANNQAAGLIASQRGVNPGMAARLAGQASGQANQQALGQASQNQLNAQQLSANNNMQQQQLYQNAIANQNQANASIAAGNNQATAQGTSGMLGGMGSMAAGMMGLAEGGVVPFIPSYAQGGEVCHQSRTAQYFADGGQAQSNPLYSLGAGIRGLFSKSPLEPSSSPMPGSSSNDYMNLGTGSSMNDYAQLPQAAAPQPQFQAQDVIPNPDVMDMQSMPNQAMPGTMMAAKGGKVPAMVSPGEIYIPPSKVKEVAKGKDPRSVGEKIPGKPKVKGNSYANDTVPKTLEAGGVVIPNSVMQSNDPAGNAHKFVSQILAKQGLARRRK